MSLHQSHILGQAAENLVRAELLARGFEITLPAVPQSEHDLYVRLSRGWRSVQVKLGAPSVGKIARLHRGAGKIASDLPAYVSYHI
jgi:hypothetical protein